jgi:hypothetical protein
MPQEVRPSEARSKVLTASVGPESLSLMCTSLLVSSVFLGFDRYIASAVRFAFNDMGYKTQMMSAASSSDSPELPWPYRRSSLYCWVAA